MVTTATTTTTSGSSSNRNSNRESSMPSQSAPSNDLSQYSNSTAPSDHSELPLHALDHHVPESVPSLDRDLSTDLASDYLSTADASLVLGADADDDDSVGEPDINFDVAPADSGSIYAPSRYPSVPEAYQTEVLQADNATM